MVSVKIVGDRATELPKLSPGEASNATAVLESSNYHPTGLDVLCRIAKPGLSSTDGDAAEIWGSLAACKVNQT